MAPCRGDGSGGTISPHKACRMDATLCGRSSGGSAKVQSIVARNSVDTAANTVPPGADSAGNTSRTARITAGVGTWPVSMKCTVAPSAYLISKIAQPS
jgi:hypothetical protein